METGAGGLELTCLLHLICYLHFLYLYDSFASGSSHCGMDEQRAKCHAARLGKETLYTILGF